MKIPRRAIAAIAVAASAIAAISAQQARDRMQTRDQQAAKAGTAGISGVIVTDEQTPQPIKGAQVMVVSPEGGFTKTVYTNNAGKFAFTGLAAGRYTLTANKPAYLRVSYGARRYDRPGTPITLKDGHQMTDVALRLPRGAVIAGMITDENGEPAFGVQVRVMMLRMQNGERTFTNVPTSAPLGETTDDRGRYRVFGLPPGEYAIVAQPRIIGGEIRAMTDSEIRAVMQALQQQQSAAQKAQAGAAMPNPAPQQPQAPQTPADITTVGYSSVYYPGSTTASTAATVTVAAGEERSGVDFPLRLVRTARIEGSVVTPDGIRPQGVQLMLTPLGPSGGGLELFTINRAPVDADGKFAFTAVPPGQYQILARAAAPGALPPGMPPPPPPPPPPPGGGGTMQFRVMGAAAGAGAEPITVMPDMVMGGGGAAYWGQVDVSVDGTTLTGISVPLNPGMTITGKVTFKSTRLAPGSDLSRVRLLLAPVQTGAVARLALGAAMSQVEPNGQFKLTGVTPGRYRISGTAPLAPGSGPGPGWTLLSAVVKGQDALDFPVDILPNEEINDVVVTFTDAAQEVNGSLQDATGRPAPDFTIVVFAADTRYWTTPTRRIRSTRPGTDGRFSVSGLPPGEYRIAALVDVAPGEINDPAFLEQLVPASIRFTLAEGERKTQDLKIAGGL